MSHIIVIHTEVRDPVSLAAACVRQRLPAPIAGNHRVFTNTVSGWGVQLPDWRYPVVCQTDTGQLHYDTFEGRWGNRQELDRFLQTYAVELATLEARRHGYAVQEQPLPDGSIKLTVMVGGAA